ncbi:hypothetical protein B0H11DRAFT_1930125 [Mycena galericulata]|nr:hypothetical protein B0H11DRAFT_1930125 [Mycena galericulata]
MPVEASRSAPASDVWSFNLRSTKTNDSDSDSASDDDATNTIVEETPSDLDISSREESVVYKPNPFSIAKINAATRATRASAPVVDRRPKPAPRKQPTGRIVDCFKSSKKSETKNSSRPDKDTEMRTITNTTAIPGSTPINAPILSTNSTDPPIDLTPPVADIASGDKDAQDPSSTDVDPRDALLQVSSAIYAHNSTASPPQKINLKKKHRTPAPVSFSSPPKAPYLAARRTTASNEGSRSHISFSSPIRPPTSASLRPFHPTYLLNNSQTKPTSVGTSKIQISSTFYQSRPAESRLAPIRMSQTTSNPNFAHHGAMTSGSATHLPAPSREAPTNILTHHLLPASSPTNGQISPSVDQCTTSDPHSQSSAVRRRPDHNLLSQLPPSSPIHSFTPTPSPSPRRKRQSTRKRLSPKKSNQTLKRQKSDAYNFFGSDPDNEWSTLPVRKKAKVPAQIKPKIDGIKTTAAFRLPGPTSKAKISGMGATSERRVVTFLPPPLKSGKVEVAVEDAGPRVGEPGANDAFSKAPKHSHESSSPIATSKRRRLSENPYPSPANSRLTTGVVSSPTTASPPVLSLRLPIQPSTHRMPSPPTSDPIPEWDADAHATVTVGGVSERYPPHHDLDASVAQARCGIVHRDNDSAPAKELPVVVWEAEQKA